MGGLVRHADHLRVAHVEAEARARAVVAGQGRRLLGDIQRRASGRPGPRIVTRAYVDSWRVEYDTDPGTHGYKRRGPRATVGTDHEAGFRLERGFHGTDSLGRHFVDSPGYPHVHPASLAAAEPLALAAATIFADL
jgi:hypothetical protein